MVPAPLAIQAQINVKIFNRRAESNWSKSVQQIHIYLGTKRKIISSMDMEYGPRVLQVEMTVQ